MSRSKVGRYFFDNNETPKYFISSPKNAFFCELYIRYCVMYYFYTYTGNRIKRFSKSIYADGPIPTDSVMYKL